jgi:hypothetical protein
MGRSRDHVERLARMRIIGTSVTIDGRVLYRRTDVEAVANGRNPREAAGAVA